MFKLHIENGHVFNNGKKTTVEALSFSHKVKEVLHHICQNDMVLDFEKHNHNIALSGLRPDIKTRLINAIMDEDLCAT